MPGQRQGKGEYVPGLKAGIGLQHFLEAAQEQPGGDQQEHCKADLQYDEGALEIQLRAGVARTLAPFAQRVEDVVRIPARAGAMPHRMPVMAAKANAAANMGQRMAISLRRGNESGNANAAPRTSNMASRTPTSPPNALSSKLSVNI